jgi:hypothetical protein
MLVEDANELAHQFPRMIVSGRLRDGYDLNAVLAQLADSKLHIGAVTEESVE